LNSDEPKSEPQRPLGDFGEDAHAEECPYGCPICAGITLVRSSRPDVTAHLAAAAKEFFMAAKAFLDSIAEQRESSDQKPRMERIPLD
jgi:hypothetical protein